MTFARLLFGIFALVPMLHAGPFPCVSGTLASYISLGVSGCAIGNIEFVNFTYSSKTSGGTPGITPDMIQVDPVLVVPQAASLTFSAKWQAEAGQSEESLISYTVIETTRHSAGSLTLQLGAASVTSGVATVGEKSSVGALRVYSQCSQMCQSRTVDTVNFSPVPDGFRVANQVKVSSTSGTTSLSGFTAIVNLCPACV